MFCVALQLVLQYPSILKKQSATAVSENTTTRKNIGSKTYQTAFATTYYGILGLHPSASPIEIRRQYRELSKRYHPDTTDLPKDVATAKFQELNNAYATLSNPERRQQYDQKIGYSRINVIQSPPQFIPNYNRQKNYSSSAYLDATDRPLSGGEIFALFILGLTFIGCLLLAVFMGLTQGSTALQISLPPN